MHMCILTDKRCLVSNNRVCDEGIGKARLTWVHAMLRSNVDTDVIVSEEPPAGSTRKPEEVYGIIERFSQVCCPAWRQQPRPCSMAEHVT